jgi:hypothetical protein
MKIYSSKKSISKKGKTDIEPKKINRAWGLASRFDPKSLNKTRGQKKKTGR